jgi:PIN domain nuclease of toxin-antitoxin system
VRRSARRRLIAAAIDQSGLIELPVAARQAAAVTKLPLHHTDPFDRLLIAQALTETFRFVTADRALALYGQNIDIIYWRRFLRTFIISA